MLMRVEMKTVNTLTVFFLDLCGILMSYFLSNAIRFQNLLYNGFTEQNIIPILFLIIAYIGIFFFQYSLELFLTRTAGQEFCSVIKTNLSLMLIIVLALFCIKELVMFSRLWLLYFCVCNVSLMFSLRILYKAYLSRFKKRSKSTKLLIVTVEAKVNEILRKFEKYNLWQYDIKGLVLIDAEDEQIGQSIQGIPIVGNYGDMYGYAAREAVDEVFVNLSYGSGSHLGRALQVFEEMGITVDVVIQVFNRKLSQRERELRSLGGYETISFSQTKIPYGMLGVKRTMDIVGGFVGIVLTGIITVFLAPALLLESPGPLFFSQIRVGKNGRKFKMYKFRSMYKDAEARKKELMSKNQMKGLMFKMDNDPRITKVGKFIRKTSLDEFPQFWNVLKGDMSLVGTRPPTMDEFEKYETHYKRRLSLRPGITGMWQVSGRSDIEDFEEVLALDLKYIDNWSIGLDLKILFKTVGAVFASKGAK